MLSVLLIGLVFFREEGIGMREEGIGMREEGEGKREETVAEVLDTRKGGRRSVPVAEALEASGYDTVFLKKMIKVIKVNRVTKVTKVTKANRVFGGYWKNTSNWKSRPEALEGRGRPIDINTADSLVWIGLKGIGPAFAHRILLFREKLGGFHEVNQLKEVYGLDSLWVKEHKAQLHVGKGIYRKFRLNSLEWSAFRHPYLSYAQAKIVLQYRKQHGPFKDLEALQSVALFDLKQWERILPYLAFE